MLASLQFGDNGAGLYSRTYLVAECNCHFTRRHNHFRPDGNARCDRITIKIVAPGKDDLNLVEWYIDGSVQNGRLLFELPFKAESVSTIKEILFEDASCLSLAEYYDINSTSRRTLTLEIVSDKIVIDSVEFKNGEE